MAKLYETDHPKLVGGLFVGAKGFGGNDSSKPPLLPFKKDNGVGPKPVFGSKNQEIQKVVEGKNMGRKSLTPEEMSDRRDKGMCYFCDEPYSLGHYLKHKKK